MKWGAVAKATLQRKRERERERPRNEASLLCNGDPYSGSDMIATATLADSSRAG